jgi:hypothetical protein
MNLLFVGQVPCFCGLVSILSSSDGAVAQDPISRRVLEIDLDFQGSETVILPEAGTQMMLPEFRPAASNYSLSRLRKSSAMGMWMLSTSAGCVTQVGAGYDAS